MSFGGISTIHFFQKYRRFDWHLVYYLPIPFVPFPAGGIDSHAERFMAGKGSFKERGRILLSDSLPLSNKLKKAD